MITGFHMRRKTMLPLSLGTIMGVVFTQQIGILHMFQIDDTFPAIRATILGVLLLAGVARAIQGATHDD